jgi:hypothetical protein
MTKNTKSTVKNKITERKGRMVTKRIEAKNERSDTANDSNEG